MIKNKSKPIKIIMLGMLCAFELRSQNIENITFSALSSSNDNFQPIVGTPYCSSLTGANGSLEISASYGEGTYVDIVTSIKEHQKQTNIVVYPNPTTYIVNVDLSQLQNDEHQIQLTDLNGKTLFIKNANQSIEQIDMTSIACGTYILCIKSNQKQIETFQIIKTQ